MHIFHEMNLIRYGTNTAVICEIYIKAVPELFSGLFTCIKRKLVVNKQTVDPN